MRTQRGSLLDMNSSARIGSFCSYSKRDISPGFSVQQVNTCTESPPESCTHRSIGSAGMKCQRAARLGIFFILFVTLNYFRSPQD